jgi:RND superfamily putative drug exporter
LARWARYAARHGWRVVGGWVAVVVLVGVLAGTLGSGFVDSFSIPGAEAQKATDLLRARFASQAGDSATIVFQDPAGVNDPQVRQRIETALTSAAALPDVSGVVSPYQRPGAISSDGTIAYADVQYAQQANDVPTSSVDALTSLVDSTAGNGLRVEVGGQIIAATEGAPPGSSELIGVAAAIVILLIAFGSVIAMGLPIATALVGLGTGVLGITLATIAFDMSTFTPAFAAMIGIGVGIDYALFIVTRFREGLHSGLEVVEAVARATDTAGRAVIFAGTIVVIALLGLFAIGIPFIAALGVAAAIVVGTAVLVAVTLLPALLGLVGRWIDRLRIPGLHAVDTGDNRSFSYRWSRLIQRRPIVFAAVAAALLLALATPALDLRLGFSDNGNNPTTLRTRRAYDLLATGFGPGFNGPLLVVVERDGGLEQATLDKLSAAMQAEPGVVAVSPANLNPAGDTAILAVTPTTAPQDQATSDLVNNLRSDVIRPTLAGTDTVAYVGGGTAAFVDIGDRISSRMPLFFAVVIGLSFLLLMAVFRSVVIPLKAAVMNLLSICAAYGVLVAVFQWGWLGGLIGVGHAGPIESFLPMMLFAILFGLSMDYEVFLLSRIREEYVHGGNSSEAVANGLAVTARVISAAAAIMVTVFASFILGGERVIKEFGLGLGVAIFVDATIVRMILVPATMQLLGSWNWWFPRWLDRALPRLNIEGGSAPALQPEAVAD